MLISRLLIWHIIVPMDSMDRLHEFACKIHLYCVVDQPTLMTRAIPSPNEPPATISISWYKQNTIHMTSHKPIISSQQLWFLKPRYFYLLTALTRNTLICKSTAKKEYSYIVHRHTYVRSKRRLWYLPIYPPSVFCVTINRQGFLLLNTPLLPELIMLK